MKYIRRSHLFLLLSLLSLAFSPLTQAASYKWTDAQGNVHYSQRPPQNKSYEKIKTPKYRPSPSTAPRPAPASTSATASNSGGSDSDSGEDILEKERANNIEIRKKNCEQSKHNLNAFSTYRRIKETDGTVRSITDVERAERKRQAEQGIKEFCG